MRLQLLKSAYGVTAFLLTATSAIQMQQITESPNFSTIKSGVDFTTSGDSGLEPVPPLISVEPDGQACGTGTSKKKKLRIRQKTFCTENSRQPALNSQEQLPAETPGTMTIPDTLPAFYTQEHTGHEKVRKYCPEIDYTAHLCCDGPIGPLELTPRLIHLKYVEFCQGRTFSLLAGPIFCTFVLGLSITLFSGPYPYLSQGVGCVLQITCGPPFFPPDISFVFSERLMNPICAVRIR